MTKEILDAVGRDLNTSAKVLPISADTTLLNPIPGCQPLGKKVLGVIFVPSVPANRENRERIRNTWGKYRFRENILLFFMVGNSSQKYMTPLKKEAKRYSDIIIDDFQENYYALPIKILRALKWFLKSCPAASFFIKVDEDVVVNVAKIGALLRNWPQKYHLGGKINYDNDPHLQKPFSKFFVPKELWPGWKRAPPYLDGPCYVIRRDVVEPILKTSFSTPLYHLEDVLITGIIANERLKLIFRKFEGVITQVNLNLWYLWNYFSGLCDFTYLHTDQNYAFFTKIFDHCEGVWK
jgi:hypothetical protein